jgi:hypothetical protein
MSSATVVPVKPWFPCSVSLRVGTGAIVLPSFAFGHAFFSSDNVSRSVEPDAEFTSHRLAPQKNKFSPVKYVTGPRPVHALWVAWTHIRGLGS